MFCGWVTSSLDLHPSSGFLPWFLLSTCWTLLRTHCLLELQLCLLVLVLLPVSSPPYPASSLSRSNREIYVQKLQIVPQNSLSLSLKIRKLLIFSKFPFPGFHKSRCGHMTKFWPVGYERKWHVPLPTCWKVGLVRSHLGNGSKRGMKPGSLMSSLSGANTPVCTSLWVRSELLCLGHCHLGSLSHAVELISYLIEFNVITLSECLYVLDTSTSLRSRHTKALR